MARRKCYVCGEYHPEEYTTLTSMKTGGNYRTAQASRTVRVCYRCKASDEYRRHFQLARPKIEGMAKWGWVLGDDYGDYQHGWDYFRKVLWPDDQWGPTDPSTIPARLLPPPEDTD
jgi:ribosomal protein S14